MRLLFRVYPLRSPSHPSNKSSLRIANPRSSSQKVPGVVTPSPSSNSGGRLINNREKKNAHPPGAKGLALAQKPGRPPHDVIRPRKVLRCVKMTFAPSSLERWMELIA
ncbi:hypothetical protein CDAR_562341 [Caerostris darwini]|uniref:Uncharacterized protein n=1 Tax=Caerostris darwini TaxID=1538125 RepID=A0AAV4X9N3_9ARAC|nr:hypothetical protein CDAR_562341 [Caerostris darwini]